MPPSGRGEETRLEEILEKVHRLNEGIEDETAKVVFRVFDGEVEKKSTHRLYWKSMHGRGGLISKFMLLTVSPANLKGEGFLVWEGVKLDDSQGWLYLPELRQVRRIDLLSQSHTGHHHSEEEPESDLLFGEMANALSGPGERRIAGEETIDGEPFLLISERSRSEGLTINRRYWVSPRNGTTRKIEHLDPEGRLLKTQWIEWQEVGDVWLWKKTEVRPSQSARKTVIELSEIQINRGLEETLFTDNFLRSGRIP
jgi:outer membrane lipoprotein-sorting protein